MSEFRAVDNDSNYIQHFGIKRHSGRYEWGSGANPYQHEDWFLSRVDDFRKQGLSMKDIALALDITQKEKDGTVSGNTGELRRQISIANNQLKAERIYKARSLKSKGMSNVQIAREMFGDPKKESTVRTLLKDDADKEIKKQQTAVNILRRAADSKTYVDVGVGVERELNISEDALKTALRQLQNEGYNVYPISVDQLGTDFKTTVRVLTPPDKTYGDVYKNKGDISSVKEYVGEDGQTVLGLEKPQLISKDRIYVKYVEDGGGDKDGVIELRKGVEDISLGNSDYAQVRIGVEGNLYLKGMAMYSDDIPKGYDILVNSNKSKDKPDDAYKKMKTVKDPETGEEVVNWDNPFGASIKIGGQRHYTDENGKDQLSVINKVNEEGDWNKWSKTLSAQFLSKQSTELISSQLKLSVDKKKAELADINSLTNPTIKKKMLEDFAEDCDASAVHLKSTNLPRQSSKVILPLNDIADDEVYAPTYRNGEKVALVRYPHGGIFEIPVLTVNNNNPQGKSLLGNVQDAIGIGKKAASQLSGADFDGDTVVVIPTNNRVNIQHKDYLKDLQGLDEEIAAKYGRDYPTIKNATKQKQMGVCTNLIMDMTLKGADEDEIVRAVKQSRVIIDSEKHQLDYKQSYKDYGIKELQQKYQSHIDPETGKVKGGAGTIITRAKSEVRVNERTKYTDVNPDTGEKIFKETGATYQNKKGETLSRQIKSTQMYETDDARKLMSTYGTTKSSPKEELYADYANALKAMANDARKEAYTIKENKRNPSATKAYADEVKSLETKLDTALRNAPKERLAQIIANNTVDMQIKADPSIKEDSDKLKKVRGQALNGARAKVGAKKEKIEITDKEWEAIQANAVSANTLKKILNNSDPDKLRDLATPKNNRGLSTGQLELIKAMYATGNYTLAEIADELGVSTSTISRTVKS